MGGWTDERVEGGERQRTQLEKQMWTAETEEGICKSNEWVPSEELIKVLYLSPKRFLLTARLLWSLLETYIPSADLCLILLLFTPHLTHSSHQQEKKSHKLHNSGSKKKLVSCVKFNSPQILDKFRYNARFTLLMFSNPIMNL